MADRIDEASDVIVIGGGIAGLGAARELARNGWRVTLLEARERLGGRIFPAAVRGLNAPVELGAEFIHGNNDDFRALLRRAGVRMKSVSRDIYHPHEGRLVKADDYWKRTTQLMKKIPANTRRPFARFLNEWVKRLPAVEIARVRDHVESFNAAQAEKMSAAVLSEDHAGADKPQYRPDGGYANIIETLAREVRDLGVTVRLGTIVRRVKWMPGEVTIDVDAGRGKKALIFRAKRVVVTLPLGVLKRGAVTFSPALKAKAAIIKKLGWGEVRRVALRFSPKFWRQRLVENGRTTKRPSDFPFIAAAGNPFPVWWMAENEPLMVGWAGGRLADPVRGMTSADLKHAALRSLSAIWNIPIRKLRTELTGFWTHDWTNDPYSRGAYSYAVAGFESGPAQLSKPVKRTLYFAGEATAKELATVHGALASGVGTALRLTSDHRRDQRKRKIRASH